VNVSRTIPTTVQIRRWHLIGLIVATALLTVAITWPLVGTALDARTPRTPQSTSWPSSPAAVSVDEQGNLLVFPGRTSPPPGYPRNYRGMP